MIQRTPDHFIRRLENWGAYYRGGFGGTNSSPTAMVCEQMAIAAGKTITDGYRVVSARREIDEADAQTIEWCWARMDYRVKGKKRGLLKAHFVLRNDMRGTCRALGIRLRSYEKELAEAVGEFEEAVALFESIGHNCAQTSRPPAKAV